jgi:hypothetical protein
MVLATPMVYLPTTIYLLLFELSKFYFRLYRHLNLAPITISLKSEQFHFKEEEFAEQLSPEDNNNETVDSQPTLLQTAQPSNPGGDGAWQTLFEPAEAPQTNTAPESNSKQDDLLELHAVFQAQQVRI